MRDPSIRLVDQALALQALADQVREGFGNRACAIAIPGALARIEDALIALDHALHDAARTFMPPVAMDRRVAERFAVAAGDWPGSVGGTGPSHEAQIELLTALHDAAATLREAGRECGRAAHLLAASMDRR